MTQKFYELHSIAFPKPLLQPAASALLCLICVHVFISHMELSLYFQSHVPVQLLSGLSGWGTLREKSAAESPCGCLACFHLWFIQIKPCFWCGGASPTHSQMKEFFLESQWRWDTGALYLWTRWRASSQKWQGWFWQARWLLLLLPCPWGRGWWSVYTQAPVPVGETSLQCPNCSLRILVLLIFRLD